MIKQNSSEKGMTDLFSSAFFGLGVLSEEGKENVPHIFQLQDKEIFCDFLPLPSLSPFPPSPTPGQFQSFYFLLIDFIILKHFG